MTITQANKIVTVLAGIDLDIRAEDLLGIDDIDDLESFLSDNDFFNVEIIYYTKAMDYLREHDPSLQESLGLANETGYSINMLGSEVLASLLASENVREDFAGLRSELEEILEDDSEPVTPEVQGLV